jgi:hypothetical protein
MGTYRRPLPPLLTAASKGSGRASNDAGSNRVVVGAPTAMPDAVGPLVIVTSELSASGFEGVGAGAAKVLTGPQRGASRNNSKHCQSDRLHPSLFLLGRIASSAARRACFRDDKSRGKACKYFATRMHPGGRPQRHKRFTGQSAPKSGILGREAGSTRQDKM